MPKTSWVWNHSSITLEGFIKCNVCDAQLHYGESTSTIHKHLKNKHNICGLESGRSEHIDENESVGETANNRADNERNKRPRGSLPPTSSSASSLLSPSPKANEIITKALAKMIAVCQLPLSFSHSQGFVDFMKVVAPGYKVLYPQAIKARLGLAYTEVREKISQRLQNISYAALTTDEWSSVSNEADNERNKRPRGSSPPTSSSASSLLSPSPKANEIITKALAKMIAVCQLPLSFSHSQGFVDFMKVVAPGYKVPYPQAIKARLGLAYTEVREKISQRLQNISYAALTTDEWSSVSNEGYLSTTIHFIDPSWSLFSHAINTAAIEDRPNAENLAIKIEMVLEDWAIGDKVHAIVHDNANVMNATVRLLNKESINCAAHTLHLCVQETMKNVEEYEALESKAAKIVSHFKHSNVATSALTEKQSQLGMNAERLVQSCSTRWDSIYHMCDVLYRNRSAVCAVLGDRALTNSRTAVNLEISEEGWSTMEGLIKLLKPLQVATKFFCSETKVTLSAVRPIIKSLVDNHYVACADDSNPVEKFKELVVASLKNRFRLGVEMFEILPQQKAAFLDPRYKDLEVEGSDVAAKIRAEIKIMVSEMSPMQQTMHDFEEMDNDLDFLLSTENRISDSVTQFDRYLAEPQISNKLDPLVWWRSREQTLPVVASLAKRYLSIPASSASSERLFSTAGHIVTAKRSCLAPDSVNMLVFLNQNKNLL